MSRVWTPALRAGSGVPSVTQNTLELAWGSLGLMHSQVSSVLPIKLERPLDVPKSCSRPSAAEGQQLDRGVAFTEPSLQ